LRRTKWNRASRHVDPAASRRIARSHVRSATEHRHALILQPRASRTPTSRSPESPKRPSSKQSPPSRSSPGALVVCLAPTRGTSGQPEYQ
jgi:hypothetical protein